MITRICILCKKDKILSEFNKGKYKGYIQNRCRDCGKALFKKWYSRKRVNKRWMKRQSEKTKRWYRCNLERALKAGKDRRRNLRMRVLKEYGNKCICCGEDTYEFLGIDHVKNNGGVHRKLIGRGIYEWLVKNNYPQKDFQILCHNCNWAKALYKMCPHKKYKVKILNGGKD